MGWLILQTNEQKDYSNYLGEAVKNSRNWATVHFLIFVSLGTIMELVGLSFSMEYCNESWRHGNWVSQLILLNTHSSFSPPCEQYTPRFLPHYSQKFFKCYGQLIQSYGGLSIYFITFFYCAFLVAQMVEPACNAGDLGLIPGLGRSPTAGNGSPVFLPGELHEQRSLVGYSPCDHKQTQLSDFHLLLLF